MAGFRATGNHEMRSDSRALRFRPEEVVGTKIALRGTPAQRGDLARPGSNSAGAAVPFTDAGRAVAARRIAGARWQR